MNIENFNILLGKTLSELEKTGDDQIIFHTVDGESYKLHHIQDCCETVYIDDICGDLRDLIGSPILKAEERQSDKPPSGISRPLEIGDTQTWTFYEIATIKGSVTIRWHGTSNGYYSESVDFSKI